MLNHAAEARVEDCIAIYEAAPNLLTIVEALLYETASTYVLLHEVALRQELVRVNRAFTQFRFWSGRLRETLIVLLMAFIEFFRL